MYNTAYILLGSNLGEKQKYLVSAKKLLGSEVGEIVKCSKIYESEPWGFSANELFLNQVIIVKTEFSAFELLKKIQEIEKKIGRKRRGENYSSRIIDIDILFFNNAIIETDELIIPHKHLHKRMFTLMPLYELNKYFVHPKTGKNISELKDECADKSEVKVLN